MRRCKMKNLLPDDRPREKLRNHGAAALGDNELVALVIGNGSRRASALSIANDLLAAPGGLQGLARRAADDPVRIAGTAARAGPLRRRRPGPDRRHRSRPGGAGGRRARTRPPDADAETGRASADST